MHGSGLHLPVQPQQESPAGEQNQSGNQRVEHVSYPGLTVSAVIVISVILVRESGPCLVVLDESQFQVSRVVWRAMRGALDPRGMPEEPRSLVGFERPMTGSPDTRRFHDTLLLL